MTKVFVEQPRLHGIWQSQMTRIHSPHYCKTHMMVFNKSIIYDDSYFFFLPYGLWRWNTLEGHQYSLKCHQNNSPDQLHWLSNILKVSKYLVPGEFLDIFMFPYNIFCLDEAAPETPRHGHVWSRAEAAQGWCQQDSGWEKKVLGTKSFFFFRLWCWWIKKVALKFTVGLLNKSGTFKCLGCLLFGVGTIYKLL